MAKDSQVVIKVPVNRTDTYFTTKEILSYQLMYIKNITKVYLNQTVNATVILVLSYFNNTQTNTVSQAAILAGLGVKLLISKLRAASNAYHINAIVTRHGKGEDNVLDYFLIYNISKEGSSITVKYSL